MAVITNQNQDPNQQQQQGQGSPFNQGQPQAGEVAGGGSAINQASGGAPTAAPQGSGRFTNIQKYLTANQAGGQQLASDVGQKVTADVNKAGDKANTDYSQIAHNVNQAQNVKQQGTDYFNQLKGINQNLTAATGAAKYNPNYNANTFGINELTSNPLYDQYQKIQTGQAYNPNALTQLNQQAQGDTQNYLNSAQQNLQKVNTEGGRFDLLRQSFGSNNPQYSQGQQRLDQLLLSQGGGLGQTRQQLAQNLQNAQTLQQQGVQTAGQVQGLNSAINQGIGNINSQAKANTNAYVNMLNSYVNPIQAQRDAQWDALQNAFAAQNGDVSTGQNGFTAQQLKELGVDASQPVHIYNTLNDLNASNFATKGLAAKTAQDVASAEDVARYKALANIAGIPQTNQALTQAGNLGAAYTANTGDQSLGARLTAANKSFNDTAANTNLTSSVDRWRDIMQNSLFGRNKVGDAHARATGTLNVANALKAGGPSFDKGFGENNVNIGGVLDPASWITSGLGGGSSDSAYNDAYSAAKNAVVGDLKSQYQNYLENAGYGKFLRVKPDGSAV